MARKSDEKVAKLMAAYQMVGLDEDFSRAIIDGGNAKHIVETWKAPWRGNYAAEHPAIRAVLTGNATPDEAKSLLEAAKNHRDLVDAVASGEKSMTWAHTVLGAGFSGHKEAVSALLIGADPEIIADLLDIPLSKEHSKIIRKGGPRRSSSDSAPNEIDLSSINKLTKHECVSILARFGLSHTGSEALLRDRINRFRKILEQGVAGIQNNNFKINTRTVVENNGRARRVFNPYTRRYDYKTTEGLIALNVPGRSTKFVKQFKLSGEVNKSNLNKLAAALKISKPSKMTKKGLLTQIMNRALFFGIIDEDQYEDFME